MKGLSHSEMWINTKYFIDALRCVCSLLYFYEHIEISQFIDPIDFVDGKLHRFYINLCALVDMHCDLTKSKSEQVRYKRMLRVMCPSLNWIFYERDKNAAHKDIDYDVTKTVDAHVIIAKMKQAINTVQCVCSNTISLTVSICYYAYDPLLFRYVNGITPILENKMNEYFRFYPDPSNMKGYFVKSFDVIWDARQMRMLNDSHGYGIIVRRGLIGQPYDLLQHLEDFCIKLNVMSGSDCWVSFKNHEDEVSESVCRLLRIMDLLRKDDI